jgi:hypothetical protein
MEIRTMKRILLSSALILLTVGAAPALAEQQTSSGKPLQVYCNSVPDLSVRRNDAVDNWIKICTVWLNAGCGKSIPAAPPKTGKSD